MSSLIELKSRNDLPFVKVGDVSLCSNYAPDVEARRWVDSYARRIESSKVCFIMGLGCGYHCSEAAYRYPDVQFIAVEKSVEIANWFWRNTQRQVENLSVIRMADPEKVDSWLSLASDLARPYTVLAHAPSLQLEADYYQSIYAKLLARDFESYQFMREISPTLAERLPEIARVPDGYGINVQNILGSIDPTEDEARFDKAWDSLGELVR